MLVALHVLNELRPSGMEKMLESSSALWPREGWKVVLVGTGLHHTFVEELRVAGYEVFLLPKIKSIKGFMQLASLIRSVKPDVLHNHSESCHGLISLMSRCTRPRTPIVRTIHNCFKFSGRVRVQRILQHYLESFCGVFRVSVSSDVQFNERSEWKVSSTVIENWMDPKRVDELHFQDFLEVHRESLRVCVVGNCSSIKDHAFALQVINEFDQIELVHIGESAGMEQTEKILLDSIEQRGRLLHDGPTDKVLGFFKDSDLHIICSKHEGAGVVVIESVVLGLETWVRDVPGLRWAFGLPGVRVFRSQEELRQMLSEKLSTNYIKRTSNEIRIKEMERFSPQRGVLEYTKVYMRLLEHSNNF